MNALLAHPLPAQLLISLAAGAGVWLLASPLHRWLQWPADSRGFWWGALGLILLPAPLAWLLPRALTAGFDGLLPSALLPLEFDALSAPEPLPVESASVMFGRADALELASAIYLLGLVWLIARRLRGALRLRAILGASRPIDAGTLPGPRTRRLWRALARRRIELHLTAHRVSPFAVLAPRPRIVLPVALVSRLDDRQCWLLLRHEACHLQLRDPQWMRLLDALCALHWFNPFVWALARRLRLATELRCDRPAIRQKHMRRAYAEAYLETLRMSATRALPCAAAAFSTQDQGHHKMRIAHILSARPLRRKSPWATPMLLAAGIGLAATLTAAHAASIGRVEIELAANGATAPSAARIGSAPAPDFRGPIIGGRISSGFGQMRPKINSTPHRGIDLVAARGTPVRSPAAGQVISAEASYSLAPNYGTVVVIDHGEGWQTLYAHLDSFAVTAGERVQAGDTLGTVGSTGLATGPHVHVEVLRDGQRMDPAQLIRDIVAAR
jgi:biotin carboxyl carrier protein